MFVELVEAGAMLAIEVAVVVLVVRLAARLGAAAPGPPPAPPAPPRRAAPLPPAAAGRPDPPAPPLPPNTVEAGGRRYLRVAASPGGTLLHLAAQVGAAAPGGGRPAVTATGGPGAYDSPWLRLPQWDRVTLCGLPWTAMADHRAETAALLARAGRGPGGDGAYVCPVCAARVAPDRPLVR